MSEFPTPDEIQEWLHQEEQDDQGDGEAPVSNGDEACASAACANCPRKDECDLKPSDLDEFLAIDEIGLRIKPAPTPLPEDVFEALRQAIAVSLAQAMQNVRRAAGADGLKIKFEAEVTAFVLQVTGREQSK
jgi:hypothetical protein